MREKALASPAEFSQHCLLLVPPSGIGCSGATVYGKWIDGLIDAMKKQNDHLASFEKTHHFNTHAQHLRQIMQTLSQNLFNHCMGDASAYLRTLHFGLYLAHHSDHVT